MIPGLIDSHAHMDREAWEATLRTRRATFWSRSRRELWEKGASSGNTMLVRDIRLDCDRDAVLLQVDPRGPACHTGATSCFFEQVELPAAPEDASPAP